MSTAAVLLAAATQYVARDRAATRANVLARPRAALARTMRRTLAEQGNAMRSHARHHGVETAVLRATWHAREEQVDALIRYGSQALLSGMHRAERDMREAMFTEQQTASLYLADPIAEEWMRMQAAQLIRDLTERTRDQMRDLLAQSVNEGWSIDRLADEIADAWSFSPARAELIARTETAAAYSEGSLIQARQLQGDGLTVQKEWLVNEPEDDDCIDNGSAGFIGIDELFPSGHSRPPVHPNCECAIAFRTVSGDAADLVDLSPHLDMTQAQIDDILARRRAGETFPTIAAAYGKDYGAWAYAVVKKNAPELLGRQTATGYTRVVRAPKTAPAPAAAASTTEEWWTLPGDKLQSIYPQFAPEKLANNVRAIKAEMAVANEPVTKFLGDRVPAYLRDIKVFRTTRIADSWVRDQVDRPFANAFVSSIESRTGKAALRPPPLIGIVDSHSGWTKDTEFTMAHELGHHAIYRAGLLHPDGIDGEIIANLWAENLLGRQRYATNLGVKYIKPGYTTYGDEWYKVSQWHVDYLNKVLTRGYALGDKALVTMKEADEGGVRFGLWKCHDGIAPVAVAL